MIVGFGIMGLTGDTADTTFNLRWGISMAGLLMTICSIWRLSWIVMNTYRCPNCKAVPMSRNYLFGSSYGYEDQVNPDPETCPNCGIRLKQ